MANETQLWQGVIVNTGPSPTGKSIKVKGQKDGRDFTFNLGADKGPGPQVGQTVELKYSTSAFTGKDGKEVKSKWIENWKPIQASLPEVQRHNGSGDTLPTVEQQFVKEVVGGWANAGQLGMDSESVKTAIRAAVMGWRAYAKAEQPTVPATGPAEEDIPLDDIPPPASARDYGAPGF